LCLVEGEGLGERERGREI